MIREIFRQLGIFRDRIVASLTPPVVPGASLREGVEVPIGSINEGAVYQVAQTTYLEGSGVTCHVFILDIDMLDSTEAQLD